MKKILYCIYYIEWYYHHRGKAFRTCRPVCYDEWLDCEFAEMMIFPQYYENRWFYFIIEIIRDKRSKGDWK